MPAGLELTDPEPVPSFVTFSVSVLSVKVAVTECTASIVTMQSPVPVQPAPDQPVKSALASGVAVRGTTVPNAKACGHVAPHVMAPGGETEDPPPGCPAGVERTAPPPVPFSATSSVFGGFTVKVAVTERAAFIVTTQPPVPEHPAPDHPANVEFASGVAVNVTSVLKSNVIEHVGPQSIPAGVEVTEPVPVPFLATSSVCCG